MTIKEQLKGTCVYCDSPKIGLEIIEPYDKAGIKNTLVLRGDQTRYYYGEYDGALSCGIVEQFVTPITINQLRDIVNGNREEEPRQQFQPGDIVEEWFDGAISKPVVYRFFIEGKNWVSETPASLKVYVPQEIRPFESKVVRKVKELVKVMMETDDWSNYDIILEAIEWGQANSKL